MRGEASPAWTTETSKASFASVDPLESLELFYNKALGLPYTPLDPPSWKTEEQCITDIHRVD